MPFPRTIDELVAQGYKFKEHATCAGCPATIEWWITPRGKRMPMDVDAKGNVVSHFVTCPQRDRFSRSA